MPKRKPTQSVSDVMTGPPFVMDARSTAADAATAMRERDIGDVIVCTDGKLCGIVTDRDLVVRVVAEGKNPSAISLKDICSREITSLEPGASVDDAVELMRERALRRLPVVQGGTPVGILSLGDLAIARDPGSALADISAAEPNG